MIENCINVISHESLEANGFNRESSDKYTKDVGDYYLMVFTCKNSAKVVVETKEFMHEVFVKTWEHLDDFLCVIKKHAL